MVGLLICGVLGGLLWLSGLSKEFGELEGICLMSSCIVFYMRYFIEFILSGMSRFWLVFMWL